MNHQEYRAALTAARAALIEAGYCGPGDHGTGDDEVLAIDRAFNADTMLRNIIFNTEQSPGRHTAEEIIASVRSIAGLEPGEKP